MGFSPLFLRFHPEIQPRPIIEVADGATNLDLFDDVQQVFYIELTQNSTLTLSNPKDGGRYTFITQQDAGGGNTLAFAGSTFYWAGGVPPVVNAGALETDVVTLVYSSILVGYADFQGLAGAAGAAGAAGVMGVPGMLGDDGDGGSIGLPGATGATGATGAMGMPGFDGDEGEQGPIGITVTRSGVSLGLVEATAAGKNLL